MLLKIPPEVSQEQRNQLYHISPAAQTLQQHGRGQSALRGDHMWGVWDVWDELLLCQLSIPARISWGCQPVRVTPCDYQNKLETCFSCDTNPVPGVEMCTGDAQRPNPHFWGVKKPPRNGKFKSPLSSRNSRGYYTG